jgi:hypothetical protein
MGKVSLQPVESRLCEFCGTSFTLTKRQVRRNKRFCSKSCAGHFNQKEHIKNLHNCLVCGKELANDLQNLWVLCRSCHAKKTMIEIDVLYSVGFEKFVERINQLTEKDIIVSMKTAHDYWSSVIALKYEFETQKIKSPENGQALRA